MPDYRLRITFRGDHVARDRRSLSLRPGADRLRPAPVRRRARTTAPSRSSARTASRVGIDDRRALRGVGAERRSASASSATSTAGTAACTRCACWCRRASGRSSSPTCRTASSTSSRSARAAGRAAEEDRSVRRRVRDAAADRVDRPRHLAATSGATTSGWRRAPAHGGWLDRPMSIYEVHLGSWARVPEDGNRFLTYRELARPARALREGDGLHAHRAAAGDGASVLRVVGLSGDRLLRADQPLRPARRLQATSSTPAIRPGIGVILDWVPGHFPKDAHGLARFDGTALYEHADPRQGEHQDWGTLIFNYGRNEVRTFLLSNALFWLEEYHIDGLRVDAVASMLYLDYSRQRRASGFPNRYGGRENLEAIDVPAAAEHADARRASRARSPWRRSRRRGRASAGRCTSAASASPTSGTWAGCTTCSSTCSEDPVHRRWHHNQITFSMLYAFTENFMLPFSHDEVVHGKGSMLDKMPGDVVAEARDAARALRLHVRASRQEAAVHGRRVRPVARVEPRRSLDWHLLDDPAHAGLQRCVQR